MRPKKLSLNKRVIMKLQENHLSVMRGGTIALDTDVNKGCYPSVKVCDKTSEKRLTCTCSKD